MFSLIFSILISYFGWSQNPPVFRLSLFSEPVSLSVYDQKTSSASYLLGQIHSPLLWYQDQKLQPRLASCKYDHPKQITCQFLKAAKFSNGEQITPLHFQKMALEFLNTKKPGQRADLLLPIQNAENILNGKVPADQIGLVAKGDKLIIKLEKADSDFIYNLANPILSPQFHTRAEFPQDPSKIITSGAYQIQSYENKAKIKLKPNPYFPRLEKNPPDLEFRFIAEDSVALSLYEKNEIDFLRRLPTVYIPKFKNRNDFYFIPQFRFDYIGMSAELIQNKALREAMTKNLNYTDLQKLFDSRPRPGCVGIPAELYLHPTCFEFSPAKVKMPQGQSLRFHFSKQGGDDHVRTSEWIQAEWKKYLGIQIELKSMEDKLYIQSLEESPPALFRKGLSPDRPTCLAVLENFLPKAKENYLKIENEKLSQLVQKLKAEIRPEKKRRLCQDSIDLLMQEYRLIPTGPISFALLVRPEFQNWRLNELNQLDLSELKYKK